MRRFQVWTSAASTTAAAIIRVGSTEKATFASVTSIMSSETTVTPVIVNVSNVSICWHAVSLI